MAEIVFKSPYPLPNYKEGDYFQKDVISKLPIIDFILLRGTPVSASGGVYNGLNQPHNLYTIPEGYSLFVTYAECSASYPSSTSTNIVDGFKLATATQTLIYSVITENGSGVSNREPVNIYRQYTPALPFLLTSGTLSLTLLNGGLYPNNLSSCFTGYLILNSDLALYYSH